MSEWQPIETAPDRVKCIWWIVPLEPGDANYYHIPEDSFVWPFIQHGQLHVGRKGTWSSLQKATHWHALPEPPT